jgi:hypothetical protein
MFNKLYLIINKFKSFIFNKTNLSKQNSIVLSDNIFDPKLKIYMFGVDLFHDKVAPLINYLNLSKFDSFLFNYFYKKYPMAYFTQWLIKNRSTGSFKIIDSLNGEILCIRNFFWVFGVLISEESLYLGYNGVTSEIITEKYLLLLRDIELRHQGSYGEGEVTPVSFAFEIEALLPEKKEDYLNLIKWDFRQSKTVVYPKKT